MNKEYLKVKDFAIKQHKSQKYGIYNYEVHLIHVVGVLLRNGIDFTSTNQLLLAGAWLHDVLEDTDISKEKFIDLFGIELYNLVWALTDGQGETRKEKKAKMYKKLVHNQNAIIVKLADRIANLEFSIINNDTKQINKYIEENERLNEVLKNNINTELVNQLLNQLNDLVEKHK